MECFFIIIGVVALVILIISSDNTGVIIGTFCATITFMLGLISLDYERNPSAIDVYRGKTELKITGTYKDSIFIPTDSTVIFKRM